MRERGRNRTPQQERKGRSERKRTAAGGRSGGRPQAAGSRHGERTEAGGARGFGDGRGGLGERPSGRGRAAGNGGRSGGRGAGALGRSAPAAARDAASAGRRGAAAAHAFGGSTRRAAEGLEPLLKPGRRKGEWMEIRLPEPLAGAPLQKVMRHTPLAPRLVSKLMQTGGLALQGSALRLRLFPREERDFPADWMEMNVLYEDDFTLVVHKPAGIEVHPSEKGQRRTLAHAVSAYYEMTNQDLRIRHIHRIDKETTGPVLYAKHDFAHYQYDKDMREKKIERVYLALAEGVLEKDKGTIDLPIGQDRHHSTRRRVSETGDPAVTHYEVAERFADHTLVRLRLETGRTHQIRVHLAAIGHPLAGDGMYGGKRGLIDRQALHGERLIWHHPWTGERLSVRAPLPDDLQEALARLRG